MNHQKIIAGILLVAATTCVGQGHVNFANDPALFVNDPNTDRLIYCLGGIGGTKLTGDNWAAQLWYGVGFNLPGEQITMTADPIAHFFQPGTGVAGAWDRGDRILAGTSVGQTVTMQVRVWDISRYPTYNQAVAAHAPHGPSDLFNYTVPADDAPSDAFLMYGFRGFAFTCLVPEPGTWALIALGGIAAGVACLRGWIKKRWLSPGK